VNASAESNPSSASQAASGAVHSAGPYLSPSSSQGRASSGNVTIANSSPPAGSAEEARNLYSSSDLEWGSYASDKKKGGEK
jgi:hypothetical protein